MPRQSISAYSALFMILLMSANGFSQETKTINSIILDSSKLTINGTSNVTDFKCVYEESFNADTLQHRIKLEQASVRVDGDTLNLKIDSFDCGKRGINRDFRSTLRAKDYPNIQIELQKVYQEEQDTFAEVLISIAGQSRVYTISFSDVSLDDGGTTVTGVQRIEMTDFGIDPPKALFGLIKVRNELDIQFELNITQ